MSEHKYPPECLKYGHDHSGSVNGAIWTIHTEQCKNDFGGWFTNKRCPHIQTFHEALEEKWGEDGPPDPPPPPPPMPPREIHIYHHYPSKKTKTKK